MKNDTVVEAMFRMSADGTKRLRELEELERYHLPRGEFFAIEAAELRLLRRLKSCECLSDEVVSK